VTTLIANPQAYSVAANLINSPVASWLHHRTGAIYPYLPELEPPDLNRPKWRPSLLPHYTEPRGGIPDAFDFDTEPPYPGHRWLPLKDTSRNLRSTPIAESQYDAWGKGWVDSRAMGSHQCLSRLFSHTACIP